MAQHVTNRRLRTAADPRTSRGLAICSASAILLCGVAFLTACAETVEGPVTPPDDPSGSIAISALDSVVSVSGALALSATVLDGSGSEVLGETVTWSSSVEGVGFVTVDGVLVGVSQGATVVTASAASMSTSEGFEVRGHSIGAAGGRATSPDGNAFVEIPPGALSQAAAITIGPADESGFPGGTGYVPGSGYEFGPSGQGFLGTIRLSVVYNPASLPAGIPENSLRVNRLVGGSWSPLPGATIDMAANTVTGATSSFSVYGVVGSSGGSTPPTNTAPVAAIQAPLDGTSVTTLATVAFQGTGQDTEDGALPDGSLSWTSSLDGSIGTGSSLSRGGMSVGTHDIELKVVDSDGVTATDNIMLSVTTSGGSCSGGSSSPEVTISSPQNDDVVLMGTMIGFTGSATDDNDGTLTGGQLVWTSDLDGQIGLGENFQLNSLSLGKHKITLTGTDSCGDVDTVDIVLFIV